MYYKVKLKIDPKNPDERKTIFLENVLSVSREKENVEFIILTNGGAKTNHYTIKDIESIEIKFKNRKKGY